VRAAAPGSTRVARIFRQPPVLTSLPERADHHLDGFDIAMQHPRACGECNRITDTQKDAQPIQNRRQRLDVLIEAAGPLQTSWCKKRGHRPECHIVHRNDSRMFQPRQYARFAHQAICQVVLRAASFEHLRRPRAVATARPPPRTPRQCRRAPPAPAGGSACRSGPEDPRPSAGVQAPYRKDASLPYRPPPNRTSPWLLFGILPRCRRFRAKRSSAFCETRGVPRRAH